MKTLILSILMLAFIGCGGQASQKGKLPPDTDLRADLSFSEVEGTRTAKIIYYYTQGVPPSSKTPAPLTVLEVEEGRLNGELLTPAVSEAGHHFYTTTTITSGSPYTVSAKLNGKEFEGKISTLTTITSRTGSAILNPK
jgi:hypothetical protein